MSEMPHQSDTDEKSVGTFSMRETKSIISSTNGDEPLITTLIPTYQRSRLLERAIGSALAQTYPHLRVCVYDNASGDDTRETVRKLSTADPRVRYFRRPVNIGAQKNFIGAMEGVETPFFSFLSDDDILLPRFYETAMEGFKSHPEAMLSATATLQMTDTGRVLRVPLLKWKSGLYQPPDGFLAMLDNMHPEWTSVVFRREVLQEVGTLDEEAGTTSDLDYQLRIAARFPIVASRDLGAIFVGHSENISLNLKLSTTRTGWLKLIRNQTEDARVPVKARDHARQVLTDRFKRTLFVVGLAAITRGNWRDSRLAADVLRRDYGLWIRASVLSVATWACERLPLVHRGALAFRAITRFVRRLRKSPLQSRFGSYSAYLGSTSR